jgi:hypothetical protein
VQALTEPPRWHAERGGGLRGGEPVPGHERERLSITLVQDAKRAQHAPARALRLAGVAAHEVPALGLEPQPLAPRGPSPLSSDDVASDGEQPRQRGLGHVVNPSPDDKERLGNDVVDDLRRYAAPGVSPNRGMVLTKERIEPRSPEFRIWHTRVIAGSERFVTP